ncbi:MAG: M20 family metallopeptidase [Armatimonadetes bacterium]|nr:M20 family metallopeptidase [Armatimonadota bacterium]
MTTGAEFRKLCNTMDEVTRLLADLVSIPSVNPCGREVSGDEYLETRVADYVEGYLREIGVDVERQQVHPGRDNVVGRVVGRDPSRHVLLEAHMDTMPGDNMEFDAFSPFVKDGRLYGRGSCDTKGSLAAMLCAVKQVTEGGNPLCSITVLAAVDEEYQFTGVMHFVRNEDLTRPGGITEAVVGEPTAREIIIAHKGCVRWILRTQGTAAHSSNPSNGVNAIYRMSRVVQALDQFNREELPVRYAPHSLLGGATLSVGTIAGGQVVNVVPDHCEIQVDRRLLPGEDPEAAMEEVAHYLLCRPEIEFDLEHVTPFVRDVAMETSPCSAIVRRFERACEKVYGEATVNGVPFGTDASKIAAKGIPAVVFGPGDIRLAHTSHEYVPLDEVRAAVEILVRAISE